MRLIDGLHRWTGGLLGLLLAIMGASGTLLLQANAYVRWTVSHAADPLASDDDRLAKVAARYLGDPGSGVRSIRFAGRDLGVHRLFLDQEGGGAYADQSGVIVARWHGEWQRPEVWLFDLHHHLLMGETGTTLVGIVGLVGIGFVVTGALLWWRTRATFAFSALPRRRSRTAIVRHHRDLGIVAAPLLLLSFVTGTMMASKPVERLLLAPFASADRTVPPKAASAAAARATRPAAMPWRAMIAQARHRFPGAEIRGIGLPSKRDPRIQLRLRQPGEWTPNGRTILFFGADGTLAEVRDALRAPRQARIGATEYPLHVGAPLPWLGKALLTLSGLALTLLGSLAVATFWFAPARPPRRG